MNKHAIALAVAAIVLAAGIGNASAGDTRAGRVPVPPPDEPTPRCVLIGSDIWQCTDCVESEADNMTYCFDYISKNEVPKEP